MDRLGDVAASVRSAVASGLASPPRKIHVAQQEPGVNQVFDGLQIEQSLP